MKIYRISELPVTVWSGGTTQQLAIFPESATLAERNFDFRISTATVTDEESVFTSFDGFMRDLMILDGELGLTHEAPGGAIVKKLVPFEVTRFDGSWRTVSKGKVRDFNVIFKPRLNVCTELLVPEILGFSSGETVFLFVLEGSVTIRLSLSQEKIGSGECVFLSEAGELVKQPGTVCIISRISG